MGDEEVMMMSGYDGNGDDDERVSEWELGLPSADDLTPLSQNLIPANLAAAFSITPEPHRTAADVMRESRKTLSTLRGSHSHSHEYYSTKNDKSFDEKNDGGGGDEAAVVEEADSALRIENNCSSGGGGVSAAAAAKRARLVWTPQLHKRFVEVVAHLGIKNAVPKTIMQLMNVEGLTRENVASHLQKYRLYLKRMHGGASDEDCPNPSSSDALFASTPVPPPQSLTQHELGYAGGYENGNRHMSISVPMQYPPPGAFMAMPPSYMGMASGGGGYHGGFELHRSYNNMMQHQQTYGGMVSYPPHVAPNEK